MEPKAPNQGGPALSEEASRQRQMELKRRQFEDQPFAGPRDPEHWADIENELRDLAKQRGIEIPDLDLIHEVVRIGPGNPICIHTIGYADFYRIWPEEMRGEYSTSTTEDSVYMSYQEVENFIGKYKPNLLFDLYLEAKFLVKKKNGNEGEKHGGLSF